MIIMAGAVLACIVGVWIIHLAVGPPEECFDELAFIFDVPALSATGTAEGVDPLEKAFRELERDIQQRNCDHARQIAVNTIGVPQEVYCADCGKSLPVEPAVDLRLHVPPARTTVSGAGSRGADDSAEPA